MSEQDGVQPVSSEVFQSRKTDTSESRLYDVIETIQLFPPGEGAASSACPESLTDLDFTSGSSSPLKNIPPLPLSSSSSPSSFVAAAAVAAKKQTLSLSSSSSSPPTPPTTPSPSPARFFSSAASFPPDVASSVTSSDDAVAQCNLIVNYLPAFMTQDDMRSLFESMGQLDSCKLVRDKNTGHSLGYGFVKFKSCESAKSAVKAFNGLRIHNKTIKVSYARPSSEVIKGANLYVSGLPSEVNSHDLSELFSKYGNIISIRILSDSQTGLSKGVAFIRFDLRSEAEAAVGELNGCVVFGGPVTVKFASQPAISTELKAPYGTTRVGHHPYLAGHSRNSSNVRTQQSSHATSRSGNCSEETASWTLHVQNLPPSTNDSDVWSMFGPLGIVKSVRVVRDKVTGNCKGHAFVNMPDLDQAVAAASLLSGVKQVDGHVIQAQVKTPKTKKQPAQQHRQTQQIKQLQQQQQHQDQQLLQLQRHNIPLQATTSLQSFPFILSQSSDNSHGLAQHQQHQQHQLHPSLRLQPNYQIPAQMALHRALTSSSSAQDVMAQSAFYPAVIDSAMLAGFGSVSPEFSNSGILFPGFYGPLAADPVAKLAQGGFAQSSHPVVGGSFPLTLLHDATQIL